MWKTIQLRFASREAFVSEFAQNLSRGSLYIRTPCPEVEGTAVLVQLSVPGMKEHIEIFGHVAYMVTRSNAKAAQKKPGMAIHFAGLDPATRTRVEHYINGTQTSAKGHVLIIDDDFMILSLLSDILNPAGIDVSLATRAQDACDLAQDNLFDLVVCDFHLGGMDGLSLHRILRHYPGTKTAPFVLITGDDNPKILDLAKKAGVRHVLDKPIKARRFRKLVMHHIEKKSGPVKQAPAQKTQKDLASQENSDRIAVSKRLTRSHSTALSPSTKTSGAQSA